MREVTVIIYGPPHPPEPKGCHFSEIMKKTQINHISLLCNLKFLHLARKYHQVSIFCRKAEMFFFP